MATLTCGNLSLDFVYREFDNCGWVQYGILFRWYDQPLINDAILRRNNEVWAARSVGGFRANESREDSMIPTLEEVLTENKSDYWKPIEPDIIIGFYPENIFPFLPDQSKLIYEADHVKEERAERQRRKAAAGGKLPDDTIAVIVFIDQYNLDGCGPYRLEGPALILHPQRHQLEEFLADLKEEYKAFKIKFNVDQRNREDFGDDWKPMVIN
jgi:hypothetical protein